MAGIDLNRTTAGAADLLPKTISQDIWGKAVEESVIMRLSRRINLPAGGLTIPIITGEPEADWVAETAEKPVSDATIGTKNMQGYKLAVIETFSNEFRRDLPALYAELARRLPQALGTKFDATVLHGAAPGTNFDVLSGAPTAEIDNTDTDRDFLNVYSTVALAGGKLNGWALSPQAEAIAMAAKDAQGYNFIPDAQNGSAVGRIFGQPVYSSRAVYRGGATTGAANVVGVAGDWSSAIYGVVEDISVAISDVATVNKGGTQLNLWQRNMFAIRAEVELGFITREADHFVRLTNGTAA